MAERKGDTKDTLLEELESIKGLLLEEDDIPVLSEIIEAIEPLPADTPRQPSLFNTTNTGRTPSRTQRPASITKASGENPFLPAHIRARLQGNRPPPLVDELTADPTPEPEPTELTRDTLVQEIIDTCLPELEAKLRARLQALTDEQLLALLHS